MSARDVALGPVAGPAGRHHLRVLIQRHISVHFVPAQSRASAAVVALPQHQLYNAARQGQGGMVPGKAYSVPGVRLPYLGNADTLRRAAVNACESMPVNHRAHAGMACWNRAVSSPEQTSQLHPEQKRCESQTLTLLSSRDGLAKTCIMTI